MAKVPHYRITYSGVFGSLSAPVEEWSVSINTFNGGVETLNNTQTSFATAAQYATAADSLATPWLNNMRSLFTAQQRLTKIRLASVGADGKVLRRGDGSFVQGDALMDVPGNASAPAGAGVLPLQTALVVSLSTARPDATGKGRVFLPWPGTLVLDATDYRISAASAQLVADKAALWIGGLGAVLGGGQRIAVVASSKGYHSQVTGVRVGRAPDTMRTRRGDLVEGYATKALA